MVPNLYNKKPTKIKSKSLKVKGKSLIDFSIIHIFCWQFGIFNRYSIIYLFYQDFDKIHVTAVE